MRIEQDKVTRLTAHHVKKDVMAAIKRGDAILDFSSVKTVDSSSVSLVLSWIRAAQAREIEPKLSCAPEKLFDLAKLYGVVDLIEPFSCVE